MQVTQERIASAATRVADDSLRVAALVESLRAPSCFPHPVGEVKLLETHISYVLLAGDFAYKIKKPVNLRFLDFTDLGERRRFCQEELRLNRRTAASIYLDVVPITGSPQAPRVGGTGEAIEYAVKMRRFLQDDLLDAMASGGALRPEHVDALARSVARLHGAAARTGAPGGYGAPNRVLAPALENFDDITERECAGTTRAGVDRLRAWTESEYARLAGWFAARKLEGFVRECHGDLHLGNVVLLEGDAVPFDAIDFNPWLRWIDVMSDVAFAMMDLRHRGMDALATRFLNGYLESTGDYGGLEGLRFYLVYRAAVRAKVACIRSRQGALAPAERAAAEANLGRYLALAERLSGTSKPALILMHGVSGSGKSCVARTLTERLGAIGLRSDVERKRLHGLAPFARTGSGPGAGIYSPTQTDATYERLADLAGTALRAGYPVVVDAAFLRRSQRERFRRLAGERAVPFAIAACQAAEPELRARVARRQHDAREVSEADLAVLDLQLRTAEGLGDDETPAAIPIDTSKDSAAAQAAAALARRLGLEASP